MMERMERIYEEVVVVVVVVVIRERMRRRRDESFLTTSVTSLSRYQCDRSIFQHSCTQLIFYIMNCNWSTLNMNRTWGSV